MQTAHHPPTHRRGAPLVPSGCRPGSAAGSGAAFPGTIAGPVLLGQGRRLFDNLPPEHVEQVLVRVLEAPGTLHLRYDVKSAGAAA